MASGGDENLPKADPNASPDEEQTVRVSTNPSEIYRVGIKIPPFWPEEPEIWFAQIEGQFALSNITADATKFNYVISQLDQQYCKEVKELIISPPRTNKYEKLKSELMKRLTASKDKKVEQLIMHEELGHRKPFQFLRHLKDLGGSALSEEILISIWRSRLPSNIRTVLAAHPDAPLEVLGELADRVHDIVGTTTSQVASTSKDVPGSSLDALSNEIAELRQQMKDMMSSMGRDRSSTRPRGREQRQRSKSGTRSTSSRQKYPVTGFKVKPTN